MVKRIIELRALQVQEQLQVEFILVKEWQEDTEVKKLLQKAY